MIVCQEVKVSFESLHSSAKWRSRTTCLLDPSYRSSLNMVLPLALLSDVKIGSTGNDR